jgi:CubicO group peptidase (beta-lactamase class C family)
VFERVDEIFCKALATRRAPTIAYGVIVDGELVHASSVADEGHEAPTPDHVFRIASMTKSFTAATILLLRDDAVLGLDDPVELHLPELENLVLHTADSPVLTIRHLLTMSGGLPTDDPWADRQEAMDPETFGDFLRGRLSFIAAPGTTFEYSNLGYSILGRVISNVAGMRYHDVVRARLLEPLGMRNSTFDVFEVPVERRMQGYRRVDDAWATEPFTGPGEFSALGGMCSSIHDLTRWVRWLAAAPLHRGGESSPLSAASRREMQQQHRAIPPSASLSLADGALGLTAAGYGFGLVVEQHPRFGDVAGHSGGYPGFGSHMRWHMASGTGVIALSNGTYSGMSQPASAALDAVLRERGAPSRSVSPWPATWAARRHVQRLLDRWDDDIADDLFADNVDLDEPRDRRKAAIAKAVERVGPALPDVTDVFESETEAHLAWWSARQRGRLHVSMLLTPHGAPLVQTLTVKAVPHPSATLADAIQLVCSALANDPPHWPTSLPTDAGTDTAAVVRAATVAKALGATMEPQLLPTAGNGITTVTVGIGTAPLRWQLALTIDAVTLHVTECTLAPVAVTAEDHIAVLANPEQPRSTREFD